MALEQAIFRKRFKALGKRDGQYPKRKFLCVYSDELLENKGTRQMMARNLQSLISLG